jgi:hypothetical protein
VLLPLKLHDMTRVKIRYDTIRYDTSHNLIWILIITKVLSLGLILYCEGGVGAFFGFALSNKRFGLCINLGSTSYDCYQKIPPFRKNNSNRLRTKKASHNSSSNFKLNSA